MADNPATFKSETENTPAVRATAFAKGASGIFSQSTGEGTETIRGEHLVTSGSGVVGIGGPDGGYGVEGCTANGYAAVHGISSTIGTGVEGESESGVGVHGVSRDGIGVYGQCNDTSPPDKAGGYGVQGITRDHDGAGVRGENVGGGHGVEGSSVGARTAIYGSSTGTGHGIIGDSAVGSGVWAIGASGVTGLNHSHGDADGNPLAAIWGFAYGDADGNPEGKKGLAGKFTGDVQVIGRLNQSAAAFKIDHPLDPEHKYLYHLFLGSPDMMNIYNGNVTTDENGEAMVALPDYSANSPKRWWRAKSRTTASRSRPTSPASRSPGK
jgi:hypothetical protein